MIPLQTPPEIFGEVAVRTRAPGTRADGRWIEGAVTERLIRASVQPARPIEVAHLPEGTRTRGAVVVYTQEALRPADEAAGIEADRVVHAGFEWEVQQIDQHAEGIAHFKALCVRAEAPLPEPAAPALAAPAALTARLESGGVLLAWGASGGADRYLVERSYLGPAPAGVAPGTVVPTAGPTAERLLSEPVAESLGDVQGLSFLDPSHPRGGLWSYRVRAAAGQARSLPSNRLLIAVP